MADQLVRAGAADPLDAEAERDMLQDGEVPHFEDLLQQCLAVAAALFNQAVDRCRGVAEACP